MKHSSLTKLKMPFTPNAMSDPLASLHASGSTPFQVCHSKGQTPWWFPILMAYCYNISEAKYMSTVRHRFHLRRPCVRWLATMETVWNLQCDRSWTLIELKLAKSSVRLQRIQPASWRRPHSACTTIQAVEDAEQAFESLSLSCGVSFMKRAASELNRVFQTCAPCLSLNHCTTSVLALQRCWNNAFSYTSYPSLQEQVAERFH